MEYKYETFEKYNVGATILTNRGNEYTIVEKDDDYILFIEVKGKNIFVHSYVKRFSKNVWLNIIDSLESLKTIYADMYAMVYNKKLAKFCKMCGFQDTGFLIMDNDGEYKEVYKWVL